MKEFKVVNTETGEEVGSDFFVMTASGDLLEKENYNEGYYPADPKYKALMWTGLKDKDEDKIYEEDVVLRKQRHIVDLVGEVYYDTNRCQFRIKGKGHDMDFNPRYSINMDKCATNHNGIEVTRLGNCYTHPELTEDK